MAEKASSTYSTGNTQIDNIVAFIKNTFGIDIDPTRASGWADELETGSGRGRTYEDLRSDIFIDFVGTDKINEWVRGQFADLGLGIATGDETEQERLDRITQELLTGQRTFSEFSSTLKTLSGGGSATDGTGTSGSTGGGLRGIMSGGKLVKIMRDGEPLWGIVYKVGGIEHVYTYDSAKAVAQAWGPDFEKTAYIEMSYDGLNDGDTWLLGDAAAFTGQTGQSYQEWFGGAMREAALEAGSRNPGLVGDYLNDPEVQRILAEGAAGGWSDAFIQAELRNSQFYQQTLYPGIKTFLDQGVPNPEQAYWNYMDSVDSSLAALGYERDADGSYRSQIAKMLGSGITADDFNQFAPVFIRAEQSQEYAAALNQWTERDLGKSLDFDNWFDVMAGETSPEMSQVVEKATIQFQADMARTNLTADQITRLADLTQLSEAEVAVAFSNAEEALLSVGQTYLDRYGLSQESLVNAAFGVDTEGGMSAVDVQRQARKAATELGIMDDQKAQFFVGFDRFSRPQRQGLTASAPEAG